MVDLPKTEEELQALIDSRVKEATEQLVSKHNGEMASLRTKHTAELDKVKKEAGMSAEELANQRAKELAQQNEQELADLRAYKKQSLLKERLVKENLPSYFVNDNRLLSAEEGDLDKAIKVVKAEYEASKPSGNTHSTVVQVGGNGGKPQATSQEIAYEKMGDAISQIIK